MITLNKVAKEYWQICDWKRKVNWCTSSMAVICHMSKDWRHILSKNRMAKNDKVYKDIEIHSADLILDTLNLLSLIKCDDIEELIKYRLKQLQDEKKSQRINT